MTRSIYYARGDEKQNFSSDRKNCRNTVTPVTFLVSTWIAGGLNQGWGSTNSPTRAILGREGLK